MRGNRTLRRWTIVTTIIAMLPFVTVRLVDCIAAIFQCRLQVGTAIAPCGLGEASVGLLTMVGVAGILLTPFAWTLLIIAALLWVLFVASAKLDPGSDTL